LQACRTSRTGTYHVSGRPFSEEHAGGQSASGAHSFASAFFLVSSFFCCLTGGRFLGAVTEDTLNALMENALVCLRYMPVVYYFSASSNRATVFLVTTSIETLCSLAVRDIISMCSWSITFLPQEHMALALICFVMIFMDVNKCIFYLRTGLFGLSSQPETVAKTPSFVVKRRIIPL
jgi:hypothetical protein